MFCPARARLEILVDTGAGFHAGECVERISFRGPLDRDFFVNLRRPVRGFRLDPLDTEGEFRLETFTVQGVSRPGLLRHALWSALKRPGAVAGLWHGVKLLLTGRGRQLKTRLLQNVNGPSALAPPPYGADEAYQAWRGARRGTDAERARVRAEAAALAEAPVISVLLPPARTSPDDLRRTLESVRRQLYPHWELCVVAGQATGTPGVVAQAFRGGDRRIRICPEVEWLDGARAANAALALATGRFVALLDPGDELAEHALWQVARASADGWDLLYSDEDRLTRDGRHVGPFFKPDWSPDYLLSVPYTGRLAVYRTAVVRELGGFRAAFEPELDYDLALRAAARAPCVCHVPDILYHRRMRANADAPSQQAGEAARRAVADHLERIGRPARVSPGPAPRVQHVRFTVTGRPRVSIIIPTAFRPAGTRGERTTYLARCLASVRDKTTYRNYEILLRDNGDPPPGLADELARCGITRAAYDQPFNWAATMNRGAARAAGEHLVFLDDDTEVITPDWLECLLEYSQLPEVGAVGAGLHFPDGRLQHAGITVLDGCPGHPFYGYPAEHAGYHFSSIVPRNWSAVTGACLMTRAQVFQELGGFAEGFACNFNDVDYCLRVACSGRRVVCTPYARLVHHETATKPEYRPAELDAFRAHWRRRWPRDPYSNPNLSTRFHDFRVEP
jgi:GT2 family glycosyltransferase